MTGSLTCKLGMQQTAKIAVQMGPQTKPDADKASGDKTHILDYLNTSTNKTQKPNSVHSNDNKEADKRKLNNYTQNTQWI